MNDGEVKLSPIYQRMINVGLKITQSMLLFLSKNSPKMMIPACIKYLNELIRVAEHSHHRKYGIVFISGDMIFMYLEAPEEYAKKYPGTLSTSASPVKDDWAKLMNQHFDMSFSDGKWLEVERIL